MYFSIIERELYIQNFWSMKIFFRNAEECKTFLDKRKLRESVFSGSVLKDCEEKFSNQKGAMQEKFGASGKKKEPTMHKLLLRLPNCLIV